MSQQHINTRSKISIAPYLLVLSALILVACLIGGGVLAMDSGGGGFFPNLGKALGLLLIAVGNLLSWIINLFCWYATRIRWLGIVLALQGVPAIFFAGWLAFMGLEAFAENRVIEQRTRVIDAIKADDVPAVQQALAGCSKQCREFLTFQRNLMFASLHQSHQTARYLLDNEADPASSLENDSGFYNSRTSLYTCEGTYLVGLSALDLAVANQDMEMLELLWPISRESTRSTALWTAAELDRLDMMKRMTGLSDNPLIEAEKQSTATHSTHLLVQERHGGKETLLRAAASGAAVDVGRWLLESRPIALPQDEIQRALTDLLAFVLETRTPRSISFAQLLIDHGADIHSVKINDEPALERAIYLRSKPLVTMLLELEVDPNRLSEENAAQLDALLQEPDRRSTYRQNTQGCVAP